MSDKIKVAVIGASGYAGEELIRLLLGHPGCEISVITSWQDDAGKQVGELLPRFADIDLVFSEPEAGKIIDQAEMVLLALPHGLATEFAVPFLKAGLRVVDLSADFRLNSIAKYEEYYQAHPAPELLSRAVYGMPELYREQIKTADLIASPGCYPTSIILPLAPLLKENLIAVEGIIANSLSGVSGAGRKVALPFIFPECNESVRAYSPKGHRHLPEIEQELALAAGMSDVQINFIPHLVPVIRGINSTVSAVALASQDSLYDCLLATYQDEPFVRVLPCGSLADTKHVTMTNVCEIGMVLDEHTGRLIITSAIDNLTKGASGQAIQSLNIMQGFTETAGLL